uniref:Anoctamin n=1 Tax=Panagrellus redivivus TaxID=6233 RepID=A0A7E4WDN2_PANRE
MVDRFRRIWSDWMSPSASDENLAASESSPFASPESMLTFSDASTPDALSSQTDLLNENVKLLDPEPPPRFVQTDQMPRSNRIAAAAVLNGSVSDQPRRKEVTINMGSPSSSCTVVAAPSAADATCGTSRSNGAGPAGRKNSNFPRQGPTNMYFADGIRQIDYVLAYDDTHENDEEDTASVAGDEVAIEKSNTTQNTYTDGFTTRKLRERRSDKRQTFEENLEKLGLQLERYESGTMTGVKFVLIHAPFGVLCKQAELLKIKMPVYLNDAKKNSGNLMDGLINKFLQRFKFLEFGEDVQKRMESKDYFTQPFVEQHLDCFVNHENRQQFFPRTERSRMVYDFLIRTRYDSADSDKFRAGIERLIANSTYLAAYPLHDEIDYNGQPDLVTCSDRQLLYECWVKGHNFYKYQPLHLIQRYFGTKIGLYFAWLGFYTRFLYFISLIGVLCVVFGVTSMSSDTPSNDICATDGAGERILICPSCDTWCDFAPLNGSCVYAKLTYIFDNTSTIFFAAMMSIWATLFLEGWKRYHAEIAYKWNIHDFETEDEVMRPEFQFRIRKKKVNVATQLEEPYLPVWEKFFRIMGSGMTVLFFLCLVVALVVGVIAYRAIVMQVFYAMEGNSFIQSKALIVTSITAASINLVFILIMNYFYNMLALKLTDWECPRTQTEFENSYTLKVFLFQFINFYSSLFYIAFIKGRLSGVPGNADNNHRITIDGHRLEECDPAGCMFELVVQLIVIMCGKQFYNSFLEICYPIVLGWFRRWHIGFFETKAEKQQRERIQEQKDAVDAAPQTMVTLYERDYALNAPSAHFLFDEYLEMVIQFGFVTLFVAAFPLAPLFALLNNVLEIRLDAYKFIVTARKPIPSNARNIGVWMTILDILSNLAVICNAFVIAFTSDFIPKLYYYFTRYTMHGYVDFSLSAFDARGLHPHNSAYPNTTVCYFRDFRKPPCSLTGFMHDEKPGVDCDDGYGYSTEYWIILAYRLIFVLIFEHVVLSIKSIFSYLIPDVPTKTVIQLQRERFLARQAILQRQENYLSTTRSSPSDELPHFSEDDVLDEIDVTNEPADNESIAVQPYSQYDESDDVPPKELTRIIARMSRSNSVASRTSTTASRGIQTSASTEQLSAPRFRGIISRAGKERQEKGASLEFIMDDETDPNAEPKRNDSLESFHTAFNAGSTNTLTEKK